MHSGAKKPESTALTRTSTMGAIQMSGRSISSSISASPSTGVSGKLPVVATCSEDPVFPVVGVCASLVCQKTIAGVPTWGAAAPGGSCRGSPPSRSSGTVPSAGPRSHYGGLRVDKPLVVVDELEQRALELCWGFEAIAKRDRPPNHPEIANDFCAVAIRVLGHGEWAVRSLPRSGQARRGPGRLAASGWEVAQRPRARHEGVAPGAVRAGDKLSAIAAPNALSALNVQTGKVSNYDKLRPDWVCSKVAVRVLSHVRIPIPPLRHLSVIRYLDNPSLPCQDPG